MCQISLHTEFQFATIFWNEIYTSHLLELHFTNHSSVTILKYLVYIDVRYRCKINITTEFSLPIMTQS